MLQLTKSGVKWTSETDGLEVGLRFASEHYFRIPDLIHPELLNPISRRLDQSAWVTRADGQIASEAVPSDPSPLRLLNFLMNTRELLDAVRRVTGCPEIMEFSGRVYRMECGSGHFDSWHSDLGTPATKNRRVGMSINLSPRPYDGGVFRLRDEHTKVVLTEVPNTGFGDAFFFRISESLKHMVTPVSGHEPKTAFAGWFQAGETDFYSRLRNTAQRRSMVVASEIPGGERG